jgi:DNA polymerase I
MFDGKFQKCYGGVYYLDGIGPCAKNIERMDRLSLEPMIEMERTGLQVDLSHFTKMKVTLERDLEEITEKVQVMTGRYINLGSSPQVSELLFKDLGLKQARPKMTNSGDRESTDNEVLVAIQHDHPVVPLILIYRELDKLRGTYVEPIPKLAVRTKFGEWRLYPHFKNTRIPSGRYACADPNLLAMPSRTDRGREVKEGFISKPGWSKVSCDESQIEVRVAAHRSGDPALIQVYEREEDIYSDFAIPAFHLKDERYQDENGKWQYPTVDKQDHRFPSKTCVLASIYDVTEIGLQDQMPVVCNNCGWISLPPSNKKYTDHGCKKFVPRWTENKCLDLINAFYMKYPGLQTMRKKDHRRMLQKAMVWDDWGRIQHIQAVRSVLPWVVTTALREGSNQPVQGTAQGTIKVTQAQLYNDWQQMGMKDVVEWNLQLHDELLWEVRDDVIEEWSAHARYRFENCVRLRVPIKAGTASAPSWGLLEK